MNPAVLRALYAAALRLMFLIPPERIHLLASRVLRAIGSVAALRTTAVRVFVRRDPILESTVFGVRFPAPLGLAAGFDKDADAVDAWAPLGFGFAEVGTVTGSAQPGNPRPRLFRLPADRALVNRMGFNNHGAAAAAHRLAHRRSGPGTVPVGANIGKTKLADPDEAIDDYVLSARLLGPVADFLVVNVSSPNTPGLRDLQSVDALRPLLRAVQDQVRIPVLVKIAPDLSDADIDAIADLALDLGVDGIVCTNTTVARTGLHTDADVVAEIGAGGLSGAPLADRSLEVLRRLYGHVGQRIPLVSVGGIETAEQAWERIRAGASLLQGYTGFIYGGPMWVSAIHDGLAQRLREHGFAGLAEAVGSGYELG